MARLLDVSSKCPFFIQVSKYRPDQYWVLDAGKILVAHHLRPLILRRGMLKARRDHLSPVIFVMRCVIDRDLAKSGMWHKAILL